MQLRPILGADHPCARFCQRRWMVDTLIALAFLHTSPAMRHHMVALQLSFPTRLARLQLAVTTIRHILMLFDMRRPQTRRK